MHNGLKVKWKGFKSVKNDIAFMTSEQPTNCVNEETSVYVCVCVCVKTDTSQIKLQIPVHIELLTPVTRVECVKRILRTATDAEEQLAS